MEVNVWQATESLEGNIGGDLPPGLPRMALAGGYRQEDE